jgi:peptidoglycan/LPS O-acetylase OafA/YrhL
LDPHENPSGKLLGTSHGIDRDVSAFLDAARLTAALIVVAGHTEWSFAPGYMPFIRTGHLATLAVGVFFVLSGFVISYAVDQKETTARRYFVNRAARVYSVALPALMLTLLLDTFGRYLVPEVLGPLTLLSFSKDVIKDLFSLTFLNGAWEWNLRPGTNTPFWSLSYEVPYYIIFGLWFFGRAACRTASITLLVLLGPYIAILFVLWLLGVGCYHLTRIVWLTSAQARALLGFSLFLLSLAPYFATPFSEWSPFGGGAIGLFQFFLAGIPFAGCIVGVSFAGLSLGSLAPFIRWAAGATFTLYLVHFPLGKFISALAPSDWPIAVRWFGIFTCLILACFFLAQFTERRKDWWRPVFDQAFTGLSNFATAFNHKAGA